MSNKYSQSDTKTDYDILIVGGGMVGASLAIALMPLGLKIVLSMLMSLVLLSNLRMMIVL